MRKQFIVVGLGACLAGTAGADVLWDNMIGEDGFDGIAGLSAERNTEVPDAWTADDVVAAVDWRLTGYRWIGLRDPRYGYSQAEVLVLNEQLAPVAELGGLSYAAEVIGTALDLQAYEGYIELPAIELAAGRYYFAVRLVGNDVGRNFIASTGEGVMLGQSHGIFRSSFFGFPQWVPSSRALLTGGADFSFQIEGVALPEPGSIFGLAVFGGMLAARRR